MVQGKCKSRDLSPGHYPWTAESCLCATCTRECKGMRLPTYPTMASEETQPSWRDGRNADRTTKPSAKAVHKEVCSWIAEAVVEQGTGLDCHGWRVWWHRKQKTLTGRGDHWRRKCACLSLARFRTAWWPFPPWPARGHAYSKWTTNIWTMRLWNAQK